MSDAEAMLFDYAPDEHARATDPDTSHAAAANLSTMNTHCAAMLRAYGQHKLGLTAEEAGEIVGLDTAAASKRNSDLHRMGYIEKLTMSDGTDITRPNPSGRAAKVRFITLAGRIKLAELRKGQG